MLGKYILNEKGKPVLEKDLFKWARWFSENAEKRVVLQNDLGQIFISTIFLGVSHGYAHPNKPLLYETMVFRNVDDEREREIEFVERYSTKTEAVIGHRKIYRELSKKFK